MSRLGGRPALILARSPRPANPALLRTAGPTCANIGPVILAGAWAVGMIAAWQATAVEVQGATVCPSPDAVGAELTRVAGPSTRGGRGPVDRAALIDDGAIVRLRLWRAADGAVEERALPDLGSCGERATAAAVILAAWEAHLDPPDIGGLPSPPGSAAGGVGQNAGTAPPTITGGAATWPPPALGVSVAALLSMGVGAAAALAAEVSFARPDRPLGVAAGILLVNSHDINLVTGPSSWRRAGLTSDVRWRYTTARVWAEGRAGLALTLIQISNPLSGNAYWLDPGATAGIRAGLNTRTPMPWLQISGAFWPRAQILDAMYGGGAVVVGPDSAPTIDERNLPHFELFAGLGVSFGRGR